MPVDPDNDWEARQDRTVGPGERSFRESKYPRLKQNLDRLGRFHTLLDRISDFVILVALEDGSVVDANTSLGKLLGLTVEALIGRPFASLGFAEAENVLATLREEIGCCREGVEPPAHSLIAEYGTHGVWLELSYRVALVDARPYGILVGRDITERRHIEVALRESEERFRTAFLTSPDAVNITRVSDGLYLEVNDGFLRLVGWTREEVIGRTSRELHIWQELSDRQRLVDALRRDGCCENLEAGFVAKDGRVITGLMSAHLLTLKGEQCLLSVTRDITERKRAEAKIIESEHRFRTLVENLPEAIAVFQRRVPVYVSPAAVKMFGAVSAEEFAGKFFLDLVHPDYRQSSLARAKRLTADGIAPMMEERYLKFDGTVLDVESQVASIVFDGEPAALVVVHDITERKRAEEKLQLAANVFTHAREGIVITDPEGIIMDVNHTFTEITGYSRDEVLGQNPRILKSGRHEKEFYAAMWRDLLNHGQWSGEIWNRRKNGELYAAMLMISAVRDGQGRTWQYVALFSDITELKKHQSQLEHIAHYDALTNLPNRVLLADRLQQAMAQAQRRGQQVAVVYLDLDGFKPINDNYGHDAGDQLLKIVASRMKQALREGDTLARLGGDEFVAVLLDLPDVAASQPMLTRLLAAAAESVEVGDLLLQVSASLGVAFYPQPEDVNADQLLRQADQAMYQAKLSGKNRYNVFDAEQDRSVRGHHESLERIRRALADKEFVLHYQPKVNMRSGAIIGAEALIRWQHPERGLLSPAVFLPVIEDHALAVKVGEWVIDSALSQMERWHAAGLNVPVSVNVGARQLQQADFVARLREILAAHPNVRPDDLEMEVLETSALEDLARISQVIQACRKIGVKFALDDFGTGYSSLIYLKHLPVSVLKIDQSFVRNMLEDPDDLAILEGVLGLATAFRREVIAEGVETLEHGVMLLQLGCELAQGYGIARPMPGDELPRWSATWRPDPAWVDLPLISSDDLPLLFASAEHRAWIASMENHIKCGQEAPPPLDHQQCRFGAWLEARGAVDDARHPLFQAVDVLHRQVHALGAELSELQSRGGNREALGRLGDLHKLRDALLEQLAALRQSDLRHA